MLSNKTILLLFQLEPSNKQIIFGFLLFRFLLKSFLLVAWTMDHDVWNIIIHPIRRGFFIVKSAMKSIHILPWNCCYINDTFTLGRKSSTIYYCSRLNMSTTIYPCISQKYLGHQSVSHMPFTLLLQLHSVKIEGFDLLETVPAQCSCTSRFLLFTVHWNSIPPPHAIFLGFLSGLIYYDKILRDNWDPFIELKTCFNNSQQIFCTCK